MTKEHVLSVFEQHKGEIVSGIALAESLGMTRAAIWKHIEQLREEGYDIESIKRKGYRLNSNSDILSKVKIEAGLLSNEWQLHIYKSVGSTNDVAKQLFLDTKREKIVVASEMQEAGKGRMQTDFVSPSGKGVYLSVVLTPRCGFSEQKALQQMTWQAIIHAIKEVAGVQVSMGTAGDILYEGRKLGGVLTEADVEVESGCITSMVIGIGIYIYALDEACMPTVSLSTLTGHYCNRSEWIACFLNALQSNYDDLKGIKCV